MNQVAISFPEAYIPRKSAVHARNELFIPASSSSIWFWLTNASTWPDWYANSSNMVITVSDENGHLKNESRFTWRTFNTNIQSEIQEFEVNKKLAWIAKGSGLLAYHSWLIIEKEGGCLVITEETQQGILPRLFGFFIKKGLLKQHQIWLEGLAKKAIDKNY